MKQVRREELAKLLERDPESLPDSAHLIEDLALDSLAMMQMLAWLEGQGVVIDMQRQRPATIGEVLSLLDKTQGVSVRVTSGTDVLGPTSVAVVDRPRADGLEPVLANHSLKLTSVEPDDTGFLYALAIRPETGFRWRYRGAPPSFERFAEDLWKQVLVQYVARDVVTGEPAGQVVAYSATPGMRYAYVAAVFQPRYTGSGLAAQAVAMFVRYLFHSFPLQKIYMEVPGFNWDQVRSGEGTLFRLEGVLRDHNYYAGRYWDEYLCAIYPEGE